jgi:hypothetical protein
MIAAENGMNITSSLTSSRLINERGENNMFDTNEFIRENRKEQDSGFLRCPRLYCEDGFNISIQATALHYCMPKDDDAYYLKVELGFPSERDSLLDIYQENSGMDPTQSVYPYVPVEVVNQLIDKHGGPTSDYELVID